MAGKLEIENILQRIAQLFGVEDDNVSVEPHILCKKLSDMKLQSES